MLDDHRSWPSLAASRFTGDEIRPSPWVVDTSDLQSPGTSSIQRVVIGWKMHRQEGL